MNQPRIHKLSIYILVVCSSAYALICGAVIVDWRLDLAKVRRSMTVPSKVRWKAGGNTYRVRVKHRKSDEREHYTITVYNQDGTATKSRSFAFSTDFLLAGGFVAALQADSDPDLEIVVWGSFASGWYRSPVDKMNASLPTCRTSRKRYKSSYDSHSFFLDFSRGNIVEKPFCEASERAKDTASRWARQSLRQPWHVLWIAFVMAVLLLAPSLAFFIIFRKKRHGESGHDAQ